MVALLVDILELELEFTPGISFNVFFFWYATFV